MKAASSETESVVIAPGLSHPKKLNADEVERARQSVHIGGEYLVYKDSEHLGVVLLADDVVRIGRSGAAHVFLENHTVSRRHAMLLRKDEVTEDGTSRNWAVLDDRS